MGKWYCFHICAQPTKLKEHCFSTRFLHRSRTSLRECASQVQATQDPKTACRPASSVRPITIGVQPLAGSTGGVTSFGGGGSRWSGMVGHQAEWICLESQNRGFVQLRLGAQW